MKLSLEKKLTDADMDRLIAGLAPLGPLGGLPGAAAGNRRPVREDPRG
jgi:hypothetical protein